MGYVLVTGHFQMYTNYKNESLRLEMYTADHCHVLENRWVHRLCCLAVEYAPNIVS